MASFYTNFLFSFTRAFRELFTTDAFVNKVGIFAGDPLLHEVILMAARYFVRNDARLAIYSSSKTSTFTKYVYQGRIIPTPDIRPYV